MIQDVVSYEINVEEDEKAEKQAVIWMLDVSVDFVNAVNGFLNINKRRSISWR